MRGEKRVFDSGALGKALEELYKLWGNPTPVPRPESGVTSFWTGTSSTCWQSALSLTGKELVNPDNSQVPAIVVIRVFEVVRGTLQAIRENYEDLIVRKRGREGKETLKRTQCEQGATQMLSGRYARVRCWRAGWRDSRSIAPPITCQLLSV